MLIRHAWMLPGVLCAGATVAISREERLGSAAGVKGARLHGSRCSSTEPLEWKMMFVTSSASCGDPSLSALTGAAAWCKA